MKRVILTSQSNYSSQWNAFVLNHPHGEVFHLPAMVEVYENTPLYKPFACAVVGDDDEFLGVLVACVQREFKGFLGSFTSRSILMGCPLVEDNDATIGMQLLTFYEQHIAKEVIYSQVRNLYDMSWLRTSFEQLNYKYEEHLDILHDVTKPEELIKQGISKNKRGNISKSLHKGVVFEEAFDYESFNIAVKQILETYKRIGLPAPSRHFFDNSFNILMPLGLLKLFVAKEDGHIIGSRMELSTGKHLYDWYAGADENYKNRYPNDFIPYHLLFWAKNNGYDLFDFGGAGKPSIPYGVRDHKLKFGGEVVNYGRYEKVHKPLLMLIGRLGFYILKTLKR